jgi:hypothetical protein
LARDYPRRSRLGCVADEKIVVAHDHPVVIVGIDDGVEGLPADSWHNVGTLLLEEAPSLGLAAADAMGVVHHAVGQKCLDHRIDIPGIEQPVDAVDEIDGADSVRGVHRAVENYRGQAGVNICVPSDRSWPST